jgi:hypothetical protein
VNLRAIECLVKGLHTAQRGLGRRDTSGASVASQFGTLQGTQGDVEPKGRTPLSTGRLASIPD